VVAHREPLGTGVEGHHESTKDHGAKPAAEHHG
jgi:hypothetical protein